MPKKRSEISEYRDRINEYYKNIGEQMNFTYNRINKIEARISAILEEVNNIKETANVDREEFQDTIHTVVESMKGLVEVTTMKFPKVLKVDDEKVIESTIQPPK